MMTNKRKRGAKQRLRSTFSGCLPACLWNVIVGFLFPIELIAFTYAIRLLTTHWRHTTFDTKTSSFAIKSLVFSLVSKQQQEVGFCFPLDHLVIDTDIPLPDVILIMNRCLCQRESSLVLDTCRFFQLLMDPLPGFSPEQWNNLTVDTESLWRAIFHGGDDQNPELFFWIHKTFGISKMALEGMEVTNILPRRQCQSFLPCMEFCLWMVDGIATDFPDWLALAHKLLRINQIPKSKENVLHPLSLGYYQESLPFIYRGDAEMNDLTYYLMQEADHKTVKEEFLFLEQHLNFQDSYLNIIKNPNHPLTLYCLESERIQLKELKFDDFSTWDFEWWWRRERMWLLSCTEDVTSFIVAWLSSVRMGWCLGFNLRDVFGELNGETELLKKTSTERHSRYLGSVIKALMERDFASFAFSMGVYVSRGQQ